jgi:hypothetical protein
MVRPDSATRARAPGGSFIWPNTSAPSNLRRSAVAVGVLGDNAGVDQFVIEVVAFAGALTHAGEHRVTAVALGDVVDQFLMSTVLPTPAPPNRPILPPLA